MKRGKKYIEAAKLIERGNLYEKEEAVALVKKAATAKFDETIEAHIRTGCDVMQISRSAARLFFRTEQVKKFAFLYLQKTQRQKKQKQQELIL